jgi:hypothetical protein
MIMKLALTYVFDNYPEVEVLKFKDFSTKECDNGSKVNLAAMKYLTVGKTWYEDKFGAFLDEERIVWYFYMHVFHHHISLHHYFWLLDRRAF